MGHGKLRTKKNCLNCNAQVNGQFCSVCGQENVEPGESFWMLMSHFIYDLFHYDGKFLTSLKVLLLRPGMLTSEYVRGKRASYLHPIRLYVFTSATFFIIFLTFIAGESNEDGENERQITSTQAGAIYRTMDLLNDSLKRIRDPAERKRFQTEIDALKELREFFPEYETEPFFSAQVQFDSADAKVVDSAKSMFGMYVPSGIKEYNENQAKLSSGKKDGWFLRAVTIKLIEINQKYKYDNRGFQESIKENFLHYLPNMMFVSLPAAALLFQLLYIRRRQFTYVQHGVFSLHIYCGIYILILILYMLGLMNEYLHWSFVRFLITIGVFTVLYYVYKAMRNFYGQGRWKTVFKFGFFLFSYAFVLVILMLVFLLTSVIKV